jgi:hypothetical protein
MDNSGMTDSPAAKPPGRHRLRPLLALLAILIAVAALVGSQYLKQRLIKDACLERWQSIQMALIRLEVDEKPLPSDLTELAADGNKPGR